MMLNAPLPDLVAASRLQRESARVRAQLEQAGRELSTGRREDPAAASGGDPARLYAMDAERARLTRESEGLVLAQTRIGATQTVMGSLQRLADELGVELEASLSRRDMVSARQHAAGADSAFRSAVHGLNSRFGGRALFAGAAVDGPALASPDAIMADVQALVNGASDAADAIAQVSAYFEDPGGGFETSGYAGAAADAPEASLGGGASMNISRRADAPEIRILLRGLALAAAVTDPGYAGPAGAEADLLREAAEATLSARQALVSSRTDLGLAEARLEEASARLAARRDALDLAWNEATSRDPYDAAVEFQALEQQLERVFTVTARMSQLNLTDFVR